MRGGLEIPVGGHDRITIDGFLNVIMRVHRVDESRWKVENDAAGATPFEIRHDPLLPLDAWSVHPASSGERWQTFPVWEAALRFASILH
jgi:hypothetical protein